jgi:hypothetical protein
VARRRREYVRPGDRSDDAEPSVASRAVRCTPSHEAETDRGVGHDTVSDYVDVGRLMNPERLDGIVEV